MLTILFLRIREESHTKQIGKFEQKSLRDSIANTQDKRCIKHSKRCLDAPSINESETNQIKSCEPETYKDDELQWRHQRRSYDHDGNSRGVQHVQQLHRDPCAMYHVQLLLHRLNGSAGQAASGTRCQRTPSSPLQEVASVFLRLMFALKFLRRSPCHAGIRRRARQRLHHLAPHQEEV